MRDVLAMPSGTPHVDDALAMPTTTPYFDVDQIGEVVIVKLHDPTTWDEETIQLIGKTLMNVLTTADARQFVINLEGVTLRASLLVAKLVGFQKRVKAAGGRLVLCSVDAELQRLFERTQLIKIFQIYPDQQEALQTLTAPEA